MASRRTADGIVTGRADLWEPAAGWEGRDLEDYRRLVVLAVCATPCCGAEIDLTDGYRLTLFPDGSVGEDWRLLRPHEKDGPHFVVSGGRVDGDG